ncbi:MULTISPECIES: DUF6249 domain-containing protein [Dyella]|uniref:Transmembrane protein n=2 Tax=Dyella TaxID=231454 RepID=A0A4R0Z002_9GAMM|nr:MULTISPECIES: DUF6249 domain-containing protein [Dyella]TBR39363.1 hypothetical protein EYV96_03830 [Dyella terrae]TCI13049.1 hypothetical protein EZM97_07035 [Dyella soli]
MNTEVLIPISLFVCIAWSIKTVADAYARRRIIESRGSEELVRSLIEGENTRRRHSALQWGCVLVFLALGFAGVAGTNSDQITAGGIALILGATGLGNLVYYMLERHLK